MTRSLAIAVALSVGLGVIALRAEEPAKPDAAKVSKGQQVYAAQHCSMCHSIANLEYHHFKYAAHRRPGDVHIYYYGASALSTASGFQTRPGDVFEVEAPAFGRPLRNPLVQGHPDEPLTVRQL